MNSQENLESRELLSVLIETVCFLGNETANLVRDKATRDVAGADGINARAEEIDDAIRKLAAVVRSTAPAI